MSFRTFTDSQGVEWSAWEVTPGPVDRRIADRRLFAEPVAAERRGGRRRNRKSGPAALTTTFAQGWLCFETRRERRRLAPIPADWFRLTDEQLAKFLAAAKKISPV